jgi:hypothetical protein
VPHDVGYGYVGYEDAFPASSPPPDGFSFYFRRIPKSWLIETIGKLGTTLFNLNSYMLNRDQQIGLLESFRKDVSYADRIARFIATHPTRVFAHTNLVTALTRQALLHGADSGQVPSYAYDNLLRAIALFNSKYGAERFVGHRGPETFLPYEMEVMQQMKFNFSFMLARYYKLMDWAARQEVDGKYYLPLESDFPEFFAGARYDEYAAAALVIANPFINHLDLRNWREQRGIVDMAQWLTPLQTRGPVATQLDELSIDVPTAVSCLSKRPDRYGLADLRPFVDHPLLRVGAQTYACPHQGFLRNKLGEGIYWGLFNGYKNRDGDRVALRFSQFFGRFLEDYVFGLLRESARLRAGAKVFPEHRYQTGNGGVDSPDAAFFAGDVAVFFEVTRKRLPLDEGIIDQQPQAIANTIQELFVRKARQLHKRIEDFRGCVLRYPGVEESKVNRIFPIIVTEQDFPQLIALPRMIRDAVRNAGLLAGSEVLQIMSAEDIELLHLDARGSLDLDGILSRKAAIPQYVNRDIVAYLADNEPQRLRHHPEVSLPGYGELAARTQAVISSWGLPA